MFRGWYEHVIDAKGRLAIPSAFREVLAHFGDERLVVTTALSSRHLVAYPLSRWEAFERRVRELPQFDPNVERFRRLYIGGAMECSVDRQGRILLPANLREHADLRKDVVVAGDIEKFQIWSREHWQAVRERDLEHLEEVQRTVANLGL